MSGIYAFFHKKDSLKPNFHRPKGKFSYGNELKQ